MAGMEILDTEIPGMEMPDMEEADITAEGMTQGMAMVMEAALGASEVLEVSEALEVLGALGISEEAAPVMKKTAICGRPGIM